MKRIILILASAVLLSACVKTHEDIRFSVLGDSYSTFEGYVDPDTNNVWEHYAEIGVTQVEQMWWHKIATKMGWTLELNNSFSGSLVCNYDGFINGSLFALNSFLRRMDYLGHPDVIFILGGTNDVWQDAPFGDYVYSDWTDEQLCSFRPALACLLDNVKRQHPNAKIYFLLETDPCPGGISEEMRQNLVESAHRICSHYDIDCIDLDIHKSYWHPDAKGQKNIARQVLDVIEADFNV
jgi:lysophospholipase L1-like esterase